MTQKNRGGRPPKEIKEIEQIKTLIKSTDYYQIAARKNEKDKWQNFTGKVKNKTEDFMVAHCKKYLGNFDYEYGLFKSVVSKFMIDGDKDNTISKSSVFKFVKIIK